MFESFDFQQMISAFIVLFAVIDIIGSIPIIINLKEKGKDVNAMKATVISFLLMIGFFYAGDVLLRLFHVDIESFAVAGSFVIFLLSLEMILDIEIFKNQGPIKEATLVPLVFPLLAGAGSFTTLLSLRAEYASVNIVIALIQYDMGLFCRSHDSPYRTLFRKRRNLYYPEVFRYYFVGDISPLVYR